MLPDSYFSDQPLQLTDGPQLFIDDLLIEDRRNLTRVLYHPTKDPHSPILQADQPWEGGGATRPQVIYDPDRGIYRMWYQCFNRDAYFTKGYTYYIGYAESHDGRTWTKPLMKDFPFLGYPATNILYAGAQPDSSGRHMFAVGQVFHDPTDDDPDRRYKMIGLDARQHSRIKTLVNTEPNLLTSPDGLHWTLTGTHSIFDHHSDTANHLVHDPVRGRWLLYCRPAAYSSGRDHEDGFHHRRRVSVMVSKDLLNWSYPRIIRVPDEHDLGDIDHTCVFRYGSHFIMLYAAMDGTDTGRMHMRLASSSDGLHFQPFHTYEDVIPHGPIGTYDAGIIGPACPPVARGSDLLIYYLASNTGQMEAFSQQTNRYASSGLATMAQDRFVAQRAGDQTAWLLTREFLLQGDSLTINVACDHTPGRNAAVRVEVLNHPQLGYHADAWVKEDGGTNAIPGFGIDDCIPITGDATRQTVRWRNKDLAELRGQPIYLRFQLRHADLFSFQIT